MTAEGPAPTRSWLLVLAYLAVLGFVALAVSRDREVRWHARNGLALFGAVVAVGILATLIGVLVPSLTCLYAVAMGIVGLLYVSIVVLAVVKALEGQRLMIPGISTYASRLGAAA
jgi:uncharacterized membrane protein